MKRIFSFIALLTGVISFTSCSSDDASYQPIPKLEVQKAEVMFEAEGGNGSIVVNANSTVAATTDANWLTLTVQGNKVVVTANPNITLEGRSALIKLVSGGTEAEVTATQKGSIYGIPSLYYEIGDYQASLDIDVIHNLKVTVESQADWLTATFNEETNQIEITAEDNNDADPREGSIKVTMGDYIDEITIVQSGLLLSPEKEVLKTKNDDAETFTVTVAHSRPVTVKSNDEWITATWNDSKNELTCSVTANETGWRREGTVTLTSGPVSKTVTISQFDFVNDIQGDYYLVYYSSGWKGVVVTLETSSETEGTLNWKSKYSSASDPFVVPITVDAANESFTIANFGPTGATYVKGGVTYDLCTMAMMTDGTYIYRIKPEFLPSATCKLSEEEDGVYFEFSAVFEDYEFYGLRIGYGTGGYDGYVGAYTTYPSCYLMKL